MTTAEPPRAVDLASEPDFRLGGLLVSPSACRVRAGGTDQRVEPRVMEVLLVLVRHADHTVSRDQLIDACWGGRIVSDDAVARVVAQVRALARSLEPAPFMLETVPKVGFRLTPAHTEGDAEPSSPAYRAPAVARRSQARPRRAVVAAAAVAVLVVGAGIWAGWRLLGHEAPPSGQNGHVDVMAFEARQPDPGLQKISAELSETLVRILASGGVPTVGRPLPRDSAAGDAELRVAGSVTVEGDHHVFASQVLDRRTGIVLLSSRFERPIASQEHAAAGIAMAIAADLHCALEDRKTSRTPISTEAFSLYLNACAAIFEDLGVDRMLPVTRRLVKAAPRFAAAHAMHGIAAGLAANETARTPAEAATLHAESAAAARRALRLDPQTAKAYSALAVNEGVFADRLVHNWRLEESYLRKALAIDPDTTPARNELLQLLRHVGRWNEAIEVGKGANASGDPRAAGDPRRAMMLAARGDIAEANAELDRLEAQFQISQNQMRWTIAVWWEDPKVALPKFRSLARGDMEARDFTCLELLLRTIEARRAAHARGLPAECDKMDANWRVRWLVREGDIDGAFAILGEKIPSGPVMLFYPEMAPLRADRRFWQLAKRVGLTDYWLKSGHWPDFCAEPGLPYDCRTEALRVRAAA